MADWAEPWRMYQAKVDAYREEVEKKKAEVAFKLKQLEMAGFDVSDMKEVQVSEALICSIYKVKNGFLAKMAGTGGATLIGATLIDLCETIKAQVAEEAMLHQAAKTAELVGIPEESNQYGVWKKMFTG